MRKLDPGEHYRLALKCRRLIKRYQLSIVARIVAALNAPTFWVASGWHSQIDGIKYNSAP